MQVEGSGIRSIEKGAHLLQVLRRADGPLRLADLAAGAGMTPSATRGYMVSLVRTGLVTQDRMTARYDLGEAALQLGLTALRRTDFLRLARDALAELAASLGQAALLAVWSAKGPVVVAKIEGAHGSVYEIRLGTLVNLLPTATGQVFMAHLPRTEWEGLVPKAVSRGGTLDRALRAVKESGMASTRPATLPERSALSAPVFDHLGDLRGVLTVIGHEETLDTDPGGLNVRTLRRVARALSRRLGFAEESLRGTDR